MRTLTTIATAVTFVTVAALGAVQAAEVEVKMLNRGAAGLMVFEPALVQIQPGDSVLFVATDPGHNAETMAELLPEGAEPFKGDLGADVSVTFDVEGVYGIKCLPHLPMGMVSLVVVGDMPTDFDEVENAGLPRKAQERLNDAIAEL